jgi:GNAT superfamily N-acetyltransferase
MVLQVAPNPRSVSAPPRGVRIRRTRTADASELRRFYAALSDESRRRRFLGFVRELSETQADRFCRHGFVATVPAGYSEQIVGHLSLEPIEPHVEEVAVAVADEWQHQGIGRALYAAALRSAAARGVRRLEAMMYAYNTPIRRLLTGAGRPYRISSDELGTLNLTIDLVGIADSGPDGPAGDASQASSKRPSASRRMAPRCQWLRGSKVQAQAR